MAFEPYSRVDFGPTAAGLKTVGYTLLRDGRPIGPRVTRGVDDLGGGQYGAAIAYPSHFRGQLAWDTGAPVPRRIILDVTPESGSRPAAPAPAPPPPARPAALLRPRSGVVPREAGAVISQPWLDNCTGVVATAPAAQLEGIPLTPRLRTVAVRAGQRPTVAWTMTDGRCAAVDLTACGVGQAGLVLGTLRVAPGGVGAPVDFPATSPDPRRGLMVAEVSPQRAGGPGIYVAEMGVLAPDGDRVAFSNRFYLLVERGLFGDFPEQGPPSLAEMRLSLRDSSPLENELLDDSLAFDDSEIVMALQDVVDHWNESLPPLDARYTAQNFPFRHQWKQGARAILFRIAAEHHRRNQLSYSAGGLSTDEHGQKAEQYDRAAAETWQEHRAWVQQRKMAMNLDAGWGTLLSDYSRI